MHHDIYIGDSHLRVNSQINIPFYASVGFILGFGVWTRMNTVTQVLWDSEKIQLLNSSKVFKRGQNRVRREELRVIDRVIEVI